MRVRFRLDIILIADASMLCRRLAHDWTQVRGYFAITGGLMVFESDKEYHTITSAGPLEESRNQDHWKKG